MKKAVSLFALVITGTAFAGSHTATESYVDAAAAQAQTNAQVYADAKVAAAVAEIDVDGKVAAATNGIPESVHAVDVTANAARDAATNAVRTASEAYSAANTASNLAATAGSAVAAETVARQNADATHTAAIAAETAERQGADTLLSSRIEDAVTAISNRATSAELSAETAARDAADIALGLRVEAKQDTLVSGTNIKTINYQSILGSGNLIIEGGGGGGTNPAIVSNIVESYGFATTNTPYLKGVNFTYENPSAFTVTTSNASYNAATGVASFSTAAGSGDAEGTVTFTPQNDWAKVYLRKCFFNSDAVLDEAGLGMPIEIKGIERDGKFVVQFKQIVALRCHGWASNIVIAVSDKYSDPHHINNTTNCDYQIQDEGGRWYLSNLRSWVMNAHNGDLGEDWADYPAKSDIHINSKRIIFDGNERYRLYVDESTNLIFRAGGMNGMTLGFHGTAVTNALMVTAMMVTNGIVDISFVLDNETFDPNELSVEALLRNGEWNGIAASRYVQKSINSVKFTALNSLSNELYRIKYGETYAPVLTVTLAGQVTIEGSFGINGTNIVAWMASQEAMISAGNPTFSNAVLAVGIGIDTNSVAVLNEIAAGFGGFPLDAGQSATTLGGLLAALAAAIAWLKKNKLTKGMTAGVPDDPNVSALFTSDNTSLSSTIQTKIDATVGQINTALDTLNGEVA